MGKAKLPSHLLEFYGIDCDHCVDMEPLIQKLREEEKLSMRRFEVWFNDENLRLLQKLDVGNACGGVPFFYNKQTRGWVCGATTYPNFRNWALGHEYERFLPPPSDDDKEKANASGTSKPQAPGIAGVIDSAKKFFGRIKNEGLERIQKRTEEGAKDGAAQEKDGAAVNGEAPKRNTLIQRGAFVPPRDRRRGGAAAAAAPRRAPPAQAAPPPTTHRVEMRNASFPFSLY